MSVKTEPNDTVNQAIGEGLTKREYFAGLAMASFFGGEYIGQSGQPNDYIAERCVQMADALIVALNKENS